MTKDWAGNDYQIGGGKAIARTVRDSNIELFRIITMLLIVAHHYVVNSGLAYADGPIYANPLSWRSFFLLCFGAWGKIGINCFVLITGYFMCKSRITAKKFVKLFFEWMFYRVVIQSIFWFSNYEAFSVKALIKLLVPIRNISDGFTSTYIVFFLCIPFLNILVQHLTEKQHLYLLLWCGFTYIFLGTVPGFSVTMNYVSWYMVLYVIASYIRLYPKKVHEKTRLWGLLMVGCVLLSISSVIVCTWFGVKTDRRIAYIFVTDSNTFLAVLTSVCAFMFFKNWKIGHNRTINTVAASTFGVLLIHASSDTMRQWLWKDTVDCVGHYGSPSMPLYAISAVLLIFVVCVFFDQLRIRLIEKPFFAWWDCHFEGVSKRYENLESNILKKLSINC